MELMELMELLTRVVPKSPFHLSADDVDLLTGQLVRISCSTLRSNCWGLEVVVWERWNRHQTAQKSYIST